MIRPLLSGATVVGLLLLLGLGEAARRDDPTWKETVAEGREVSRLSDEIARMESKISRWRTRYQKAEAYHKKITGLKKEQIRIRKQQLAQKSLKDNDSEAEYREEKEKFYTYMMCSKLLDAFYFEKDHDARLEVLHLCMGRKSLGPSSLLQTGSAQKKRSLFSLRRKPKTPQLPKPQSSSPSSPAPKEQQLFQGLSLDEDLEEMVGETKQLLVTETRLERTGSLKKGPADNMRLKLEKLEQEYATLRAQMRADQAGWRQERAELDAEENALGKKVYQEHYDKTAIKKEAWLKVKGEFCPVINESYSIDEDKIVDHAMAKCA